LTPREEENTAVFGIYPTYADVEEGVEALKEAGFRTPTFRS
jgi:hypothetical protein